MPGKTELLYLLYFILHLREALIHAFFLKHFFCLSLNFLNIMLEIRLTLS